MDKQELIALAGRVEKLEGPCRETDQCIHEAVVMGQAQSDRAYPFAKKYTASLDDAMTLVPEGMWAEGSLSAPSMMEVHAATIAEAVGLSTGRSPALALCAAAIRAIASQEGE